MMMVTREQAPTFAFTPTTTTKIYAPHRLAQKREGDAENRRSSFASFVKESRANES